MAADDGPPIKDDNIKEPLREKGASKHKAAAIAQSDGDLELEACTELRTDKAQGA